LFLGVWTPPAGVFGLKRVPDWDFVKNDKKWPFFVRMWVGKPFQIYCAGREASRKSEIFLKKATKFGGFSLTAEQNWRIFT
jgi:hypothetical protein